MPAVVTAYVTLGRGFVNLLSFRDLLNLAGFIYLLSLKEDVDAQQWDGAGGVCILGRGTDESLVSETIKGWRD